MAIQENKKMEMVGRSAGLYGMLRPDVPPPAPAVEAAKPSTASPPKFYSFCPFELLS